MSHPTVQNDILYFVAADAVGQIASLDLSSVSSDSVPTCLGTFDCFADDDCGYCSGKIILSSDDKFLLVGIVGQAEGTLHCVDIQGRKMLWCHSLSSFGSSYGVCLMVPDPTLIFFSYLGLKHTRTEEEMLDGIPQERAWILDVPVFIHSIHNGCLYIDGRTSQDAPSRYPRNGIENFIAVYSFLEPAVVPSKLQ